MRTVLFLALFAAASLMAQSDPNAAPSQTPPDQTSGTSTTATPPDQTSDADQNPSPAYAGPSILTRDTTTIGEHGGKLLDFRFWGQVMGIYDTGLTPVSVNSTGNIAQVGGDYGVETGYGISGTRRWLRDTLRVDYTGSYNAYAKNSFFNGLTQYLNLGYTHVISKRLTLDLRETAGVVNTANGAFSYVPLTDQDLQAIPANELFDNPTYYAQTRADLIYQKTARLSFSFGGQGYLVRRRSDSIAGLNGGNGHADAAYRITKRQTVSVGYSYTYFNYENFYGNSTYNQVTAGYSVGLGRVWDLSLSLGGLRAETTGLQQVAVDPAIAAIVGLNFVITTYHTVTYMPTEEARLVRRFRRSALTLSGAQSASPGNGVYLASKYRSAAANYSYSGGRRLTFAANLAYNQLASFAQNLGTYGDVQGGVGVTYKLRDDVHMEFRYDHRHYSTQSSLYQKDSDRISLGFAFSPGELPLSIW